MSSSFATPLTVAHQTPLSLEFFSQKYRNELPFPSPGHLPDPGGQTQVSRIAGRFFTVWAIQEAAWWWKETKYWLPMLVGRFFTMEPPGKPIFLIYLYLNMETWHENVSATGSSGTSNHRFHQKRRPLGGGGTSGYLHLTPLPPRKEQGDKWCKVCGARHWALDMR